MRRPSNNASETKSIVQHSFTCSTLGRTITQFRLAQGKDNLFLGEFALFHGKTSLLAT